MFKLREFNRSSIGNHEQDFTNPKKKTMGFRYLKSEVQFKSFLLHTLLILNCIISTMVPIVNAENVCNTIEAGPDDVASLGILRKCDVIAGHVKIAKIDITNFPDFVSSVREITGYLLIYRVRGLKSLDQIFPNLTVIRGRSLLFDEYSLAVYENENLCYLGLGSLLRIQLGSVRIQKNPMLCYLNTINWLQLLEKPIQQHLYFKENKPPYHCTLCSKELSPSLDVNLYFNGSCWNHTVFQRHCPDKCGSNGCNLSGNCCSTNCLFGCTKSDKGDCQICKEFLWKNSTGHINCVKQCKFQHYQLHQRECVSMAECKRRGYTIFGDLCIDKCPRNYKRTSINGIDECMQLCRRSFVLNTADDVSQLYGCSKIEGSITIELYQENRVGLSANIILELEKSLQLIEEITGYLKIINSPQLLSLHFFKSLNTIGGEELIDRKFAFYVVNNYHLENIWERHVAISRGRIFFHLNPMLCYEKIVKLAANMKSSNNITLNEASPNSNGERTICGEAVKTFNATVEDFNSHEVRIKVNATRMDEKRALLGYLYYYKVSTGDTPTMYDGRHGCGLDQWQLDITQNHNIRHIITNLKPFTRYAFFVRTFTITGYHIQTDAYSKINFFTTLPSKPGPVERIFYYTPYIEQIDLHWWPPKNPNGIIKKYLITVTKMQIKTELDSTLSQRNIEKMYSNNVQTKLSTNCTCATDIKMRGAPPVDVNYYDEEQLLFDDRLPELLFYVRKPIIKPTVNQTNNSNKTSKNFGNNTIMKSEKSFENSSVSNATMVPFISENSTISSTTMKTFKISENNKITNTTSDEEAQNKLDFLELNALKEQDTGAEMFKLTHANKVCDISNPNNYYISAHNCVKPKNYNGIEVDGNVHKYEIKNLEKNHKYSISIRACIEGIEDPCSEEKTIEAETESEDLEQFFREQ